MMLILWLSYQKNYAQGQVFNQYVDNKVKVHGSFNLAGTRNSNIVLYQPRNNYFASGQIGIGNKDFQIPILFNFSDRKFQYTQPFEYNYISINPSYKWAQAQIGTSFINFSPYSLNGHQFNGVGLNLTPGKWLIKAMTGRLFKANAPVDSVNFVGNYARQGNGIKVQYRGNTITTGINYFNAKDNIDVIFEKTDTLRPLAKQNAIIGADLAIKLSNNFQVYGEISSSGLVQNIEASANNTNNNKLVTKFLTNNSTLTVSNAFKTGINFHTLDSKTLIGVQYEKIDPDYQTFGGYYFVNDFENLTLNWSQTAAQNRLRLHTNIGLQRDDVLNKKSTNQERFVGNVQLTYMPTELFTWSVNYSNFTSYTFVKTAFDEVRLLNPFDQLDTLNYRQITQNAGTNLNIILKQEGAKSQGINTYLNWMQSVNKQADLVRLGALSTFTNASLNYNFQNSDRFFGLNIGANYTFNTIGFENNWAAGPIFSLRKGFAKNKVNIQLSSAYVLNADKFLKEDSRLSQYRANIIWRLAKLQSLNFNWGYNKQDFEKRKDFEFNSLALSYLLRF